MARRVQLRKKTRKSFLSRRKSRKSRSRSRSRKSIHKSRRQRGGATLEIAERYPYASVTTLDPEGVPLTRSVSSFAEEGRDDADPDAPAAEQGLNG